MAPTGNGAREEPHVRMVAVQGGARAARRRTEAAYAAGRSRARRPAGPYDAVRRSCTTRPAGPYDATGGSEGGSAPRTHGDHARTPLANRANFRASKIIISS
ncbi:hypothetical protein GCM10009654_59470 [Streptomyces hebeiensis]|uniref:Uncharacterized protein n=1 Tax=Streptomyces hebeiensis TaxID=229486 RepID=A0ABN1V4F9_9ACTN